jgi:hypothetical protein
MQRKYKYCIKLDMLYMQLVNAKSKFVTFKHTDRMEVLYQFTLHFKESTH